MLDEYDAGYENCIDSMVRQMEDMQFSIDSLHRENAKLRKFCLDLYAFAFNCYHGVFDQEVFFRLREKYHELQESRWTND